MRVRMTGGNWRLFLLIMALALPAAGCRREGKAPASGSVDEGPVREYRLRGRVESIDLTRRRVTVAHEKIEGYMDAMTMSFAVPGEAETKTLTTLKSGDRIEARLIRDTRTNLSWLEGVAMTQ